MFKTGPSKTTAIERALDLSEENEVYNCVGIPILVIICIAFIFIYKFVIHTKITNSTKAHAC